MRAQTTASCAGTSEETVIEAKLNPIGDQTRLVIEERGLPIGEIAVHGAGWQAHVEDLAAHLSGRPGAWQRRWAQITPRYEEMAKACNGSPSWRCESPQNVSGDRHRLSAAHGPATTTPSSSPNMGVSGPTRPMPSRLDTLSAAADEVVLR